MRDSPVVVATACTVGILLLASIVATKGWLPRGPVSWIAYGLTGCSMMLFLRTANVPPDWFAGGRTGFVLALTFMASALLFGKEAERTFGRPLFLSMGFTLLVLNVMAHL